MCWTAAIPVAMSAAQGLQSNLQNQQASAAAINQSRGQQVEMIKQMNYTDANLKLKERDLVDSTVQELTQHNMNRVRNMGTIRAAIGEGMLEGNSMDRVANVTEGDFLRERQGLTDNYHRDYSVILGERISNQEQTVSQIKQMQKAEPKLKSKRSIILETLAQAAGSAGSVAAAGAFKGGSSGKAAPITAAKGTKTGR